MLIKGWSSSFQILDRSVDGHDGFSFRPCIFAIIPRHIGCRFYAPPASYCPERLLAIGGVNRSFCSMVENGELGGGGEFVNGDDSAKCFLHFSVRRRRGWDCEVGRGEGGWSVDGKRFPGSRFVENSEKFCYFCFDVVGDMSCSSREFSTLLRLEFNFWQ